ncbi:SLC13 family permease [Piscibacillus salipiscarius]|uniref:SLC13 family permease n=1 Tax=Piscibacillus salipiscarius TaxID=299480 RepID=UPI0034E1BA33
MSLFNNDVRFFQSLSQDQQFTLIILGLAIYLWTVAPIPSGASSILILALMIGLGVVEQDEDAFRGFLSPALYFIVLLSLISQVLVKVQFDQVVAQLFQKISKGKVQRILIGLPLLLLVLPIFLPSAMARYKLLYPLVSKINDLYRYKSDSLFKKFGLYIISFFNQHATLIIFTGGGFSVFAYQLMVEYGVGRLSWLEWFTLLSIPLWTAMILSAIVVFIFLKWKTNESVMVNASIIQNQNQEKVNKHQQFRPTITAFFIMIIAWLITDPNVVPIIIPPMLLFVFLSLPQIGLVDSRLIKDFDWESFLLLGTSFSLGLVLSDNGTAQLIAEGLSALMPTDAQALWLVICVVFLFGF